MGGLFAVYRDDTAPLLPSSHPAGRSGAGHNKPSSSLSSSRRTHDSSSRGLALQSKENVDPNGGRRDPLGMGKKVLGGKGESCGAAGGKAGRLLAPKAGVRPQATRSKPSANGICTGTLKTRVIPDALFIDPPSSPSSSSTAVDLVPSSAASSAPQVVEIYPSSTPRGSPTSATDSGYARSVNEEDGVRSFADEEEIETTEANRRARALTESPLAEITQAFTGLGFFSAANLPSSPSPSPLPPKPKPSSRPAAPSRTRSSPSKTTISAIPPRMMPYSTTATTRRVKPGQTAPGVVRSAPKSMRL